MKEEDMITANTTTTCMDSVINEEEGNETVNSQTEELDPNTQQLERSAKRIREVLSKIKTLTYLVESEDLLEKTKTDFESILKNLFAGCRNDLGLALETQPFKSAKKRKTTPSLKKLPSRKKRKVRSTRNDNSDCTGTLKTKRERQNVTVKTKRKGQYVTEEQVTKQDKNENGKKLNLKFLL